AVDSHRAHASPAAAPHPYTTPFRSVRPGDRVLGLASSGLHSNGYSLARKVIFERLGLKLGDTAPGLGRSLADELLEPTRIYVKRSEERRVGKACRSWGPEGHDAKRQ